MSFHPVVRTKLYRSTKKKVMALGPLWAARWPEIANNLVIVYNDQLENKIMFCTDETLSFAFVWGGTPQGFDYWFSIARVTDR